ncbi:MULTISPECIES: transcriptional regulator FtrA [Comamonas]|jgi:AraC family transcriptional activator FtrA|uniref:Transcriptional regulator FtrA n=1 Tax=Comamonas squillarum TaxID=2977320 RepID=A0ABY5ZSF0_9BURK|nr:MULTISPECIES: transcriptional regulator FtrA [Comamonas]PWB14844.1 transcriptional regulator FtrA [Comamonas sp. JNW]UXC16897.1 transcriptional regulator FtrA [Comamonas sp. PR12]
MSARLLGPLVVAPVYNGLCTFEFSMVAEVFGLERPEMGEGWYRFASVAVEPGPLRAQGGLLVQASADMALLEQADLIVVPGWRGMDEPVPPALQQALRRAARRGATLASICSGAFVLAAAGLLDGRRAATHWRYAQALAQRYPAIDVDAQVLYVQDERIFTSAGSAAGLDLMLHLVRCDFGVQAANSVARRLVVAAHRSGGQAQFIEQPLVADTSGKLAQLLDQVRADLRRDWTVAAMAEVLAMSRRTFLRRFTAGTGMAPSAWLAQARMEEVRRLLESTSLRVEQIADQAGYRSVQVLRDQFKRSLGVSPRAYRASFTAPLGPSAKLPAVV